MGRVRTKTVKKASRVIVEKYYNILTTDFQTNKKVIEEIAIIPSKRLRNKIAGFVTHLMKRIQKGTVKGISLKLQEEERERRLDFVPEVSWVDEQIANKIEVDSDVMEMIAAAGFPKLENVVLPQQTQQTQPQQVQQQRGGRGGKTGGKKKDRRDDRKKTETHA